MEVVDSQTTLLVIAPPVQIRNVASLAEPIIRQDDLRVCRSVPLIVGVQAGPFHIRVLDPLDNLFSFFRLGQTLVADPTIVDDDVVAADID